MEKGTQQGQAQQFTWRVFAGLVLMIALVAMISNGMRQQHNHPMFGMLKLSSFVESAALLQVQSERCFAFPEKHLFQIRPGRLTHCDDSGTLGQAHTLQYALRLCLARSGCSSIQWDSRTGAATYCESENGYQALQPAFGGTCDAMLQNVVYAASRKAQRSSEGAPSCPDGQFDVNGKCDICLEGICNVLPGARLVHGFNDSDIQTMVEETMGKGYAYRAFNPSLATYNGQPFLTVRVGNYTHICPKSINLDRSKGGNGIWHTENMVCPLTKSMNIIEKACKIIPWNVDRIRKPTDSFFFAKHCSGIEDAIAFIWRDRLQLLGTVNEALDEKNHGGCNGRIINRIGIARLSETLDSFEDGMLPQCDGINGHQKHWIPLLVNDTLYLVIQPYPLVISKVDMFGCTLVRQDSQADISLQTVLPHTRQLIGGTPFIALGGNRFLALVHHTVEHRWGQSYSHHFMILKVEATEDGQHKFYVDWLSDAFRLPEILDVDSATPVQYPSGITFSHDSLYISYGVSDCFVALAQVDNIGVLLPQWEQLGIGSQK